MSTQVNAVAAFVLPGLFDSEVVVLRRLMSDAQGIVADARARAGSPFALLHEFDGQCTQELSTTEYMFSAVARIVYKTAGSGAFLQMTVEVLRNNRPVIAVNEVGGFAQELVAAVGAQVLDLRDWEAGRFLLEIAL